MLVDGLPLQRAFTKTSPCRSWGRLSGRSGLNGAHPGQPGRRLPEHLCLGCAKPGPELPPKGAAVPTGSWTGASLWALALTPLALLGCAGVLVRGALLDVLVILLCGWHTTSLCWPTMPCVAVPSAAVLGAALPCCPVTFRPWV